MNCPACAKELERKEAGDIVVEACVNGCGGIWFDRFELDKVNEAHESVGAEFLDISASGGRPGDAKAARDCPKCDNIKMTSHFFGPKQAIEIDDCPGCAGVWLDAGELAEIRKKYPTEKEKEKEEAEKFMSVFGAQLEEMSRKSRSEAQSARNFASALRYICPSYYLKGKQEGGAF